MKKPHPSWPTDRQTEAWALRATGSTLRRIGEQMGGLSTTRVSQLVQGAEHRIFLARRQRSRAWLRSHGLGLFPLRADEPSGRRWSGGRWYHLLAWEDDE